jgi:hypothetical protein
MGGSSISVRYWLGLLCGRNLFRESDDVVKEALRQYFIERGFERGASVVADFQSWTPVATVLQSDVELKENVKPTQNPRLVAALQGVLIDPDITDEQLAIDAKTTVKQIARMSDISLLRILWKRSEVNQSQTSIHRNR